MQNNPFCIIILPDTAPSSAFTNVCILIMCRFHLVKISYLPRQLKHSHLSKDFSDPTPHPLDRINNSPFPSLSTICCHHRPISHTLPSQAYNTPLHSFIYMFIPFLVDYKLFEDLKEILFIFISVVPSKKLDIVHITLSICRMGTMNSCCIQRDKFKLGFYKNFRKDLLLFVPRE